MQSEQRHKIFRNFFVIVVFGFFGLMFWPFFTSILLAALFAFALHDIVSKIEGKSINRTLASLILILGLGLFVALPVTLVILKIIAKINEYKALGFQNTPVYVWSQQIIHELSDYLTALAQTVNFDITALPKPVELFNDYSGTIGSYATTFLTRLPGIGLSLFVFLLSLFYFLNQPDKIKSAVIKLDYLSEGEVDKLIHVLKKSSAMTLLVSLSIALVQAIVISTFSYFCGFSDFFMIFIVTFIFALVPVIGSAPPALFLILVSFVQGNTGSGIALIIAFIIASSSDNVIKAFALKSANDKIHPIISLLALIGAILIYGAPGILLGPILTQLAFNILPIVNHRLSSGAPQETGDF
ncbi:MAG: AI-2E family transporter [Pseudobdellovibrio sp.]